MKRTIVLGPKTSPFIKTYNYEDTILTINKHTNTTELLSAKEASPYDHLIVTNGVVREVLIAITHEDEMAQNELIKIINHMPV